MKDYYGRIVSFPSETDFSKREYGTLIDIIPFGDAQNGSIFAIVEMEDGSILQPFLSSIRFEFRDGGKE